MVQHCIFRISYAIIYANTLVTPAVEFNVKEGTEWLLGNTLARGFYRVNYEADNWEKIINILLTQHNTFHEVDRMKIIDDLTSISQYVINFIATSHVLRSI